MKWGKKIYISMPLAASPVATIGIIILRIVQSISPALYAVIIASIVDNSYLVMQNGDIAGMALLLIVLFLLILFQFLGSTLTGLLYTQLRTRLRELHDKEILSKISRLPYFYIEDKYTYELIHRIDKKYDVQIMNGFQTYLRTAGNALQIISIFSIILSANAWWSALFLILFSIPLILASIISGKKNYDASVHATAEEQKANYLNEVLTGRNAALERNFYGFSRWMRNKWNRQFSYAQGIIIHSQMKAIVRMKLGSMLTAVISIAVCAMLIPALMKNQMSLGIFFGLTTAIFNFVTLVSWEIADNFNQLVQSNTYVKDLNTFMNLDEIATAKQRFSSTSIEIHIKFEHVSFKYPGYDEFILKDLNMDLIPHKHYALVGINGAGKTTLIKLLTGFYTEYEGKILINDQDIREISPDDLQKYYSIAFQDFARYNITIREYLQFEVSIGEFQIWKMLSLLNVDGPVYALPLGLDTPMGRIKAGGHEFSQGQWQRLMLARTLLHSAPIYIFDEPTSAIDPIGESKLYDQIMRLTTNHLALFITHRLGAARFADEILVLNEGFIAERGAHEELMKQDGIYAKMYETQKRWYVNE